MSMPKCTAGSTVGASSVCHGHSQQVRGLNSHEKVIIRECRTGHRAPRLPLKGSLLLGMSERLRIQRKYSLSSSLWISTVFKALQEVEKLGLIKKISE